jgi:hypothetical protein
MTATFTIEGELSERGLLEAKTAIEELLSEDAASESGDIPDAHELALRKARLFRDWAGERSWFFLITIAENVEPGEEFTFEDLSEGKVFQASNETLKSWHRSASKIMNKVNAELGTEPRFLSDRWDGTRQHYRMSEVVRDALIAADSADG